VSQNRTHCQFPPGAGNYDDTQIPARDHAHPFLAPDLVERILEGNQPMALTAERLKRTGELPLLWDEQRTLFD
jgi:hypothetical protein